MTQPRLSLALLAAAALAALTVAGCAEKPLPVAVVPQGSVAPPPVALSGRVIEAASDYRGYMRQASAISPAFHSGPEIEQSLTTGESYEPQQFSRGVIAYAALVALQDPGFVSGVRTYAVDPDGRRSLAARLESDPNYAAALPGAQTAAGLVIAALNGDGERLRGVGELVKQSAYDVQHQKWSAGSITDPEGRLAHAKEISHADMTPSPQDVAQLRAAVNGADAAVASRTLLVSGAASAPPFTPLVSRALAVAAVAALGEGGDENDAQVEAMLSDNSGGFCLNLSKLNLYQCLAVAKPWYEDIFCLGQHALIDTGTCVSKGVGVAQPVQAAAITPVPSSVTPTAALAGADAMIAAQTTQAAQATQTPAGAQTTQAANR